MNKKRVIGAALAGALLFVPYIAESSAVLADGFYVNQTNAERADITNWVANSSEQISTNIQSQHINVNDLNGSRYVIQWGDTLSGISQATGIPIRKLAYDNHIRNIDLIYAGDILILNRNGSYVPSDWSYEGHGTHVANTKVTINNFIDNSDNSVTIVNSPITVNETTNNSSTTNNNNEKTTTTIDNKDYESPVNPVATTTAGSGSSTTGSDAAAAAEKDADNINATTDSQTTTTDSNANSTSTSSSSKSGLEDSDFADEVSSKLADQLGIEASKVSVDLGDSSSSDASADSESSDADAEETDSNSQTVYDDDQSISMASDKLSATNAAEAAKKIYKQLESDDKLSDVTDADSIDVTLSTTDGGYDFNISLSSSSNDSDSDNSSESDTTSDTTSSSVTTSSDDTTDAEDY